MIFLHYLASAVLLLIGWLFLKEGFKGKDVQAEMRWIHYQPVKNYGKIFFILIGVMFAIAGIVLVLPGR